MNVLITIIGCIFPLTYSYIMFVICELNWVDVLNNTINELSDNDEDYVISKDTFLPLTTIIIIMGTSIAILYLKTKCHITS